MFDFCPLPSAICRQHLSPAERDSPRAYKAKPYRRRASQIKLPAPLRSRHCRQRAWPQPCASRVVIPLRRLLDTHRETNSRNSLSSSVCRARSRIGVIGLNEDGRAERANGWLMMCFSTLACASAMPCVWAVRMSRMASPPSVPKRMSPSRPLQRSTSTQFTLASTRYSGLIGPD